MKEPVETAYWKSHCQTTVAISSYYELVEDGKPYREWCIPAEIINRHGAVRLLMVKSED